MASEKPHRIRVRVLDGKPRGRNQLKGQLVPHVDVIDAKAGIEFVVRAVREAHLDQVRAKLGAAGLEEIPGGDTDVSAPAPVAPNVQKSQRRGEPQRRWVARDATAPEPRDKPYAFVSLPNILATAPPIWHDGKGAAGRLAGEIRCQIETLTPLLVGWERRQIDDAAEPWGVPHTAVVGHDVDAFLGAAAHQAHPDQEHSVERSRQQYIARLRNEVVVVPVIEGSWTSKTKSVLCPLRAPWGDRPVLLPGDSIKGLLRHELGALLGAPMERVAERSYSYRPNLSYPDVAAGRYLEPRLARVKATKLISASGDSWEFPERVDVLRMVTKSDQAYYPRREKDSATGRWHDAQPPTGSEPYKGGLGGGRRRPDGVLSADARRRLIHTHIDIHNVPVEHRGVSIPDDVMKHYVRTLNHLLDPDHGHFSARHPNVGSDQNIQRAAVDAIRTAARSAFHTGDLIWVEWDKQKKCIVSLGWHYYYRWAYTDTVRRKGWADERHGLFPLDEERALDGAGAPRGLSAVRRLFGYTGDNEGSRGIGKGDHEQLMGRISVNAAVEVVAPGDTDATRFLPPTFLKELGMPRPSAVEHYLEQPYYPGQRPSDQASLVTYGDAAGYDEPGKLPGRKFYLDRRDACTGEPWKDESGANRLNDRSTLALEASRPGRRFRLTVRFRDLDRAELAAILAALSPHAFREVLGGDHPVGYCSKLGYARPLGWGSVRIEAKALLLLDTSGDKPALRPIDKLIEWVRNHYEPRPMLQRWLAIHRCKHPEAADYPRGQDGNIYTYHAKLRAEHSRARRYTQGSSR